MYTFETFAPIKRHVPVSDVSDPLYSDLLVTITKDMIVGCEYKLMEN